MKAVQLPPADFPVLPFPSAADFEAFLRTNYDTLPGFHLKFAKKGSGIPSITAPEAVEVALCFGWIDGQTNKFPDDARYWLVRYTPRRANSIWSRRNVNTVARLIEEGKMRSAGLEAVNAAKADGRWDRAYAGSKDIDVPQDFSAVLKQSEDARAFFQGLNRSDRYSVLWRIETASLKARKGRIKTIVQMLENGRVPGQKVTVRKEDHDIQHEQDETDTESMAKLEPNHLYNTRNNVRTTHAAGHQPLKTASRELLASEDGAAVSASRKRKRGK